MPQKIVSSDSSPVRVGGLELLAPAGNEVCLHAAVRAGASAVYLGLADFNARRSADNFTLDSLKRCCDWAHIRGVRIFLTLNTVVLPTEVNGALRMACDAYNAGVDAFIVQDIGIATQLQQLLPQAEIHISTQMNTHNVAGIRAAGALGAARVTLARELSLEEIAHLATVAHALDMQVEVFGHGALCVCYSGQCFMSSLVGGRSANRGMCAQACRLPYELHNAAVNGALPAPGEYLLSPKDLSTIDLLPQLIETGVDSLKIEGRMKSAEYVFAAVSTYRAVLNRIQEAAAHTSDTTLAKVAVTEEERLRLGEAFSRGFTQGYLVGERGNNLMSYGRPNNRGVFVGRVVSARNGVVELDCELPLMVGDVVEFWTNKGHFAHTISELHQSKHMGIRNVEKPVGKGDRVFRVRSARAAFEDSAQDPRIPVSGEIELRLHKPARFSLAVDTSVADGLTGETSATDGLAVDSLAAGGLDEGGLARGAVTVEGSVVEAARTKAICEEEVYQHIDRFGNTPFELMHLTVTLDEGVGLGFSALHKMRADASALLEEALLEKWHTRTPVHVKTTAPKAQAYKPLTRPEIAVCAWTTNPACARAARKAGADAIYVPALNYKHGEATIAGQRNKALDQTGYPKHTICALPVVEHDARNKSCEANLEFNPWKYAGPQKPVFADNLGAVFKALDEDMLVEVGPHVPVTNALTANYLAKLGVARIWLSPELTLGQIQRIAQDTDVPLGVFVSGAAELMITEHCLLTSQGPCNYDCNACTRRLSPHFLKDRKGFEMPVITDCCGASHLFNAVPLDLCHLIPDLVGAGVGAFMVDTTLLNVEQAQRATLRALRARDLYMRTGDAVGKQEGTTTGHLFRGIS